MNPARKPLIAGNWKMHKTVNETVAFFTALKEMLRPNPSVEVAVAPPFPSLNAASQAASEQGIAVYGQNLCEHESGAYTGEVSAQMLLTSGCTGVILGHSERRQLFGEEDDLIGRKALRAVASGLFPVVCVGETDSERSDGQTQAILERQLSAALNAESVRRADFAIAYEPVWAIGTGNVASPETAQDAHHFIRKWLAESHGSDSAERVRILYGGSVKPDNILGLMQCADIDGALIGGASLDPRGFSQMIEKTASLVE